MISDTRVEKAVEFLRDTSEQYGQLRGLCLYNDANLRRVKSLHMMDSEGSLGQKEAAAYSSAAYLAAMEELKNATADMETLKAQRDAAEFTIDVWRSQNSARKAGVSL